MAKQSSRERARLTWAEFWRAFLRKRGWDNRILAQHLGLDLDQVSHWVNGDFGISPGNLAHLLELTDAEQRPIFATDEADRLIQVRLETLGFPPAFFPRIARAADAVICTQSEAPTSATSRATSVSAAPRILVLSPYPLRSLQFYTEVLTGITRRAWLLKYEIVSVPIGGQRPKLPLREYYPHLEELAGVIAVACHVAGSSWMEECRDAGLPLVLIHDNAARTAAKDRGPLAVVLEDLKGLQELVEHLINRHGCRHLHVAIGTYRGYPNRERKLRAIIEAATPLVSINAQDVHVALEYTYAEGRRLAAEEILEAGREADAVICLADWLALGVQHVMRAAGRHVRVTGYDNSTVARDFDLTSVDQNLPAIGEGAVNDLHNLVCHPQIEPLPPRLIRTNLVTRSSCCWLE